MPVSLLLCCWSAGISAGAVLVILIWATVFMAPVCVISLRFVTIGALSFRRISLSLLRPVPIRALSFWSWLAVPVITLAFRARWPVALWSITFRPWLPVPITCICLALLIALLRRLIRVTVIAVFVVVIFLFVVAAAVIQTGKAVLANYVFVIRLFILNKFVLQFSKFAQVGRDNTLLILLLNFLYLG